MNLEVLLAVLEMPAKEQLAKCLTEIVPALVEHFEAKGGPTPEQIAKSKELVEMLTAMPPSVLLAQGRENTKVILALASCVAALSFREEGLEIYGVRFKTPAPKESS